MNQALITLQGVGKTFYTEDIETRALSNINLSIYAGEYLSITGPSGCGKSTLLSIIGLLDKPTVGRYQFQDREVAGLGHRDQAQIRNQAMGFIFQSFNLISDMTVWENVLLPLRHRSDLKRAEQQALAKAALEQVAMLHREKHYPSQLSGGQQQRVAIARAIAGQPSLILADEPTGNLDSKNAKMVMDLLQDLHRSGATICIVTHDPQLSSRADRHLHIIDGQIVVDNTTAGATQAAASCSDSHSPSHPQSQSAAYHE